MELASRGLTTVSRSSGCGTRPRACNTIGPTGASVPREPRAHGRRDLAGLDVVPLGVATVAGLDPPRHVEGREGDKPRIGDHQVEGQGEDAGHVMCVEPAALIGAPPEREEVDEDPPVRDDPPRSRRPA